VPGTKSVAIKYRISKDDEGRGEASPTAAEGS
jgi:hypothetical protein